MELTPQTSSLMARLAELDRKSDENPSPTIHAREIGGGLYFLYEKIRNAAEYREQHLFLRAAIQRFLNRKLRFTRKPEDIGHELVVELIRTRYLQNDSIPQAVAAEINSLVDDYLTLHAKSAEISKVSSDRMTDWILELASVQIERLLISRKRDELMFSFVYQSFRSNENLESIRDFDESAYAMSLFIAIHRLLLKSDVAVIRYYLFLAHFPPWSVDRSRAATEIVSQFEAFNRLFEHNLRSRLQINLLKTVRRHIAPYLVLRQILTAIDVDQLLSRPGEFAARVEAVCQEQYQASRVRLHNGISRSIVFLFLTKTIMAVLVEVPYSLVTIGSIAVVPLSVNLLFPPLYMILLGASISLPGDKNTRELIKSAGAIVYRSSERKLVYKFRDRARRSSIGAIFNTLYVLAFGLSVSLLVGLLRWLHFNLVEGTIFFIFLSTVSFFGFRLSRLAHELVVVDEQPDLISAIVDFLMTPFIKIGQWLSDSYSKINFMAFLLDFLIEMPLKTI